MATYDYYREHQPQIPNIKTGSNWFFIRIDFSKQPTVVGDDLKLCEIKAGSILKSGFTRTMSPTLGAVTIDFGTAQNGVEIINAIAANGTDTWVRAGTLDDDGPITITADGYLWAEVNGATPNYGIVDLLLEVVVAGNADIDRYSDSLAEAN